MIESVKPFSKLYDLTQRAEKVGISDDDVLREILVDKIVPNKYQPRHEFTEEKIKELTMKITEVYEEIQKDYYGYESLNFREKIGYITRKIYDITEKGNPAQYVYGVIRAVKYYYDIKEGKINSLEEIVIDSTQNKYEITKEDVDRVLKYIEELEKYII